MISFDPTSIVLISIETVTQQDTEEETGGSDVRIVGYAAINLFVNRYSGQ